MAKLLTVSGDRALAEGKHGAFYNTLEEFHKYWDRVDIICPQVKSEKLKVKSIFGNVFVHPSPWPILLQPLWILKKGLEILKTNGYSLMAKNYLMTVHEYPPFYNGIGARLLWNRIKVPYVLEIHHIPGYPKAANLKEKIYRQLIRLFIRFDAKRAKAIRVVNQKETPNFLVKAGVPLEKIIYIPSAYIDLSVFRPMNLSKEYDMIFVGRLAENKGINLFLEGIKKFSVKAIIVGDGPLKKDIKLKIEKWKLQDRVLLYGWAKDSNKIAELLNKSRILIMPSYNEGGPRVVVEAMACGVPVLATPVGIVPDLLNNLPAGRQAATGGEIMAWEADDMIRKASGLLNNSDKYQRYSHGGLKIAAQFEKKETIKNYADKLKEILD